MNTIAPANRIHCPKCHNENLEVIEYSDTVDFRGMELDVENLQETRCGNCGHKWVANEQRTHNSSVIRETYGVVRDELREKNGLLAGYEIANMREYFGLNQREAATLFGGGYNAFNKYESGEVLQSFAMDRLLRLTAAIGKPAVDFLRDVFSPPSFIVISASTPSELRIAINVGGSGGFNPNRIYGTSEQTQKFESNPTTGNLTNLNIRPMVNEEYAVYAKL